VDSLGTFFSSLCPGKLWGSACAHTEMT
jgi:hypothetical protein